MRAKFSICFLFLLIVLSACGGKKDARTFNPDDFQYHDGVAWVQLSKKQFFSTKYLGIVCIDENGIEIFSMPEVRKTQVTNFCDGIAIIKGRYIIDKAGNFIHDLVEELDVNSAVMFHNNYFDGFIFVNKIVDGVNMTGLVNSDLEWIIEPTSKLNGIESKDNHLYYNSSIGYYDALTNEFITDDEYQMRHIQRCFPASGILFLSKKGSGNKFAYSSGEVSGEIELNDDCKTGFYNQNLDMILSLAYYPYVEPLSDFQNGNCLISFETVRSSTKYIGLINLSGEFLFIASGYIGHDAERIEFKDCYFDWNGNYYPKEAEDKK